MKSFNFKIEKTDLAISSIKGVVKNKGKVVNAFGFRATETGIEQAKPLEDFPYSSLHANSFPNPFAFQGRNNLLVINGDIPYYLLKDSYGTPYLEQMSLGGSYKEPAGNELSSNGLYSFADLGDYFVACNGINTLYGSFLTGTYYKARASITTCCLYKGRVIYAGFDPLNTFNDDWLTFFNSYEDASFNEIPGWRKNYIMITPVDTDPFWLFNPPDEKVKTLFRNGEIHFAPILDDSQILSVGQLNNDLHIYTNTSIHVGKINLDPIPSFSRIQSFQYGLHNQGSIYISPEQHVFVGNNKKVYGFGIDKFEYDFRDVLINLSEYSKVLFDKNEGDYYIVDGSFSFLLNSHGLTEVADVPSALYCEDKTFKF